MNILKKAMCVLFCISVLLSCFIFPAHAAKITKEGPTVTLPTITAVPGDTVVINVDMSGSPGVMAMTFTVSYDPEVLEYIDYEKGLCNDYTVVDHPDRGYVSFVNCENFNMFFEGTLLSFRFTVKEKAAPGFHEMKIRNIRPEKNGDSMTGCFADWNSNKFNPTVVNGGITVGETCSNTAHIFGEWVTAVKPLCETDGVKSRSCTRCGHTQTEKIPMLGDHDYEDFWTVDQEAADGQSGTMSRHCKNCSAVTDKKSFSLSDSEDNGFENKPQASVKEEQWDRLELPKEEELQSNTSSSGNPGQTTSQAEITSSDDTASSDEDIPNAEDIVNNAKKEKDGFGVKVYRYLFGDDTEEGIFGKLYNAFPEWLKNISPWWILALVLVIVIVAVVI